MKNYILKNDIQFSIKKYLTYTVIYLLILAILFYVMSYRKPPNNNVLYDTIGLTYDFQSIFLASLMFIFNIAFTFYISTVLFLNDIKSGMDNIFLRFSATKWLLNKMLSIFIVQTIIKFILFIILFLECTLLGGTINNIFYVFFTSLSFTMFLNILFLLIYCVTRKYNRLLFILILPALFILNLKIDYQMITNFLPIFLIVILTSLVVFLFFIKKNYFYVFENIN